MNSQPPAVPTWVVVAVLGARFPQTFEPSGEVGIIVDVTILVGIETTLLANCAWLAGSVPAVWVEVVGVTVLPSALWVWAWVQTT